MPDKRILVVGTTPDYISYIHQRFPLRVLFLTDTFQRSKAKETAPDSASEIVTNLSNKTDVFELLKKHLEEKQQLLTGVACYDCEWLSLAAELAVYWELPYPSVESVKISRSKYLSKKRWSEHGVKCPKVELIDSEWQALSLLKRFGCPIVLKPLTGSGSELTFICRNDFEVSSAYKTVKTGLSQRSHNPLYIDMTDNNQSANEQLILAEEFVDGQEYSADFIIHNNKVELIRVAKKISGIEYPFGTTLGYQIPAKMPELTDYDLLTHVLRDSSLALGLEHAICMVDFIIDDDQIILLELTPRIGGDCLPPLIRKSCGLDTIELALGFAEGEKIKIPLLSQWTEMIGLRLLAQHNGIFTGISSADLSVNSGIKEIYLKRQSGHQIILPPDDYDSWVLGHVIFMSNNGIDARQQCLDIMKKVTIKVECHNDQKFTRISDKSC